MALTNRQKNIVNPYYKEYEYRWGLSRNQWVLAGIHDTYVNFGFFPEVGLEISEEPGIISPGDSIKPEDIQAYVSVYPQNAKVEGSVLTMLSDTEANSNLNAISRRLLESGLESFYTSPTSKESQNPENQAAITGSSGIEHRIDDDLNRADVPFNVSEEDLLKQNTSQLIAIPYTFSITRRRKIRASFGNPTTSLLEPTVSTVEDQSVIPFRGQPDTIDLYNWYNNALPGEASQVYYYNPNDEKYYFVRRTNTRKKQAYDFGLLVTNAETRNNITDAKEKGISEILKLVGKFSSQNFNLVPRDEVEVKTYLDKRPSSRWVYAVTISKSLIDSDLLQDQAQNQSNQDIDFEPYQKAEKLIDREVRAEQQTLRHSTFTLKGLQESIDGTLRVLKDYENIMIAEEITPDVVSGFDIEREILKLETFYGSLSSFFLYNDITTNDDLSNRIEFVFREDMRISYIILDGVLYSKGLGATFLLPNNLVDQNAPATSFKAVDVFATFGNRTFGFIFNSLLIDNVVGNQNQSDRPLWDAFLSTYVLPRVNISPTTQQRKRDRKDFRIAKPPNIFQKIDQLTDNPPPGDLSRMAVSRTDLYYSVTSAMGSCDSVQSTLLKEAFTIYRLINGRAPVWSLTKYAALLVRDELIKEKINQERLNDAVRYAGDPAAIARDAENWVNSEISCITSLIGTAIEDQILKPAGTPKAVNNLVTKGIVNPPLRFSFKKGFNSNLWALWKKQIQLMLIAFIKQLILGVLKDIFKAALGCGPEDPFNTASGLSDSRKGINYGRIMLNDLIQGIDVVEIASDLNLTNKKVSYNENKDRRITTSAPRQDQLLQLHRDVSTIVTPTELGQLLDGTASEVLINTIDEMINAGEVDTTALFDERPEIEWDDKIVVSMYQESLSPRTGADPPYNEPDVRYAVLGFTKDNIVNYFRELGNQLSEGAREALYGEDPLTAIQSYCDDREATPPDLRWEFDLSDVQQQQQMQEAVDAKRWELISLCGMLEGKFNFQLELEDFLDSIPNAGIYDAILRWIAALSNAAMEGLMDLFTEDPVVEQPRAPVLLETPFGKSLLGQGSQFGIWETPYPQSDIFGMGTASTLRRFYTTPNQYTPWDDIDLEDGTSPRERGAPSFIRGGASPDIALLIGTDNYQIIERKPVRQGSVTETDLVVAKFEPRNNSGGYGLSMEFGERTRRLPRLTQTLYNSTLSSYTTTSPANRILPAGNTNSTTYNIIADFYFTPLARTKLPAYISSFITPYFLANDDDCITTQKEAIAKTFITSIESRVSKFFLNVGPLFRVYLHWATPDTVTAISTYMFNKITEELKEKGLYGAYIQNVDIVLEVFGLNDEQAYSRATNSVGSYNNEKILYIDDLSATEKFYEIIKQSIILVINRVGSEQFFGDNAEDFINNFYDDQLAYRNMGQELLRQLKIDILAKIENQPDVGPRGLVPATAAIRGFNPTEEQIDYIIGPNRNDFDAILDHEPEDWYEHDVQYYLPVPVLTAIHIIYFDRIVDLTTRYAKYEFETNSRIGIADDAFLAAINPTSLPRFSVPYTGFPITALGETFYSVEQMERRAEIEEAQCETVNQVLSRIDQLIEEMNAKRPRIIELIEEGDNYVAELSHRGVDTPPGAASTTDDGPGWLATFRGSDENDVDIDFAFLHSRWNWIKREVLSTSRGDELPSVTDGLSVSRILGHTWREYGALTFDDRPQVEWQWSQASRDANLSDWQASQANEPVAAVANMTSLWSTINKLGEAYTDYLDTLRTMMTYGWAQASWDVYEESYFDMVAGQTIFVYPNPDTGIPGFTIAEDYDEVTVSGKYSKGPAVRREDPVYTPEQAREMIRQKSSTECGELELIRTMITNIKEQQRLFAETRNNLR